MQNNNTHPTQHMKTKSQKTTLEIPINPKRQTAGGSSGQIHEGFFWRTGLCVQMEHGWNYETRRCSGGPNGAASSHLTHFRGVPKKRLIPMAARKTCVCSVTTGKRKASAKMYANTHLYGQAVGVGCAVLRQLRQLSFQQARSLLVWVKLHVRKVST